MTKEEQEIKKESEQVYIPAAEEGVPDTVLLQMVRLPIALKEAPTQVCGTARRVGQVYIDGKKQALYRLKLKKPFAGRKTATLPGFFLLTEGLFVPYDPTNEEQKQERK